MPSRAILIIGFLIALLMGWIATWLAGISFGVWFFFFWLFWLAVIFTIINLGVFLFGSKLFKFTYQDESNLIIPIRIGVLLISIMLLFKYMSI